MMPELLSINSIQKIASKQNLELFGAVFGWFPEPLNREEMQIIRGNSFARFDSIKGHQGYYIELLPKNRRGIQAVLQGLRFAVRIQIGEYPEERAIWTYDKKRYKLSHIRNDSELEDRLAFKDI